MKIGKLNISDLEKLVLKNLSCKNKKVLSTGAIGNDCSAIELDKNIIYLSSDPITGATKDIGRLAININCNDIATAGIKPLGIMLTLLLPPEIKEFEISQIMIDAQKEADKLGITILGGHTEVTEAVNRVIISSTIIGVGEKEQFNMKSKVEAGDRILITKGIGIEGTGIIATEKEDELRKFIPLNLLNKAKNLLNKISVLKEGLIAKDLCKNMHDVTEGGLLGALWEISHYYNLGIEIDFDKIHIPEEVEAITSHYKINPLRLISSGTMIIIVDKENVISLVEKLNKENIKVFDIGCFISENRKILKINENYEDIAPPESDELYKII